MFASLGVKGAMPSTSTQQVDKGKEKVIKPVIHDEEDNHETKHEFQLVYLDENDNDKITNVAIKSKYSNISELQTNLERDRYVVHFFEQENEHLKTKKSLMR